jgi:hypothetical protein
MIARNEMIREKKVSSKSLGSIVVDTKPSEALNII